MASLKLFVLVIALFLWDEALSYRQKPKCLYEGGQTEFCKEVVMAYQLNIAAELRLGEDIFKEDKKRVSLANEKVLQVMKKTKKSELIPALRTALESETNALFNVMVSCNGQEKEKPTCRLVLRALFHATESLVNATMQIAEGEKKEQIDTIFIEFQEKLKVKEEKTWDELVLDLGKSVLNII